MPVTESTQEVARYKHDCDRCKPLGLFRKFDLYFCKQVTGPTVIARFGTDGDYVSGLFGADYHAELGEARRRAIEAGYLP